MTIEPTAQEENKYIKINSKKRNRGYTFEYEWVNRLNNIPGWTARRMGGSSTGMPDVVATYHEKDANILYSGEFKSGYSNQLYVPYDQVIRSIKLAEMFKAYEKRYLVLAFKFANLQRHPFYWFFGFDMDDIFMKTQFNMAYYSHVRCDHTGGLAKISVDPAMKRLVEVQHTQRSNKLPFDLYRGCVDGIT